jgi:hypothetical protein
MSRILNTLDTTGVKPQFLLSGKQNYTTTLGGVISLLNIVILGLIIYAFGKNFFERTEPSMIQNIIYPERYPNYTLGVDLNFTYAARLEDIDGNVIKRTDLVYIDFIYLHYEIKNGDWALIKNKTLDYKLCEQNNFEKPELFERQGLKTAYCPDFKNLPVGGGWDETYIKFVRATIRSCKEGNFNNKGEKCGTEQEFKEILKNRLFISNYYQEYFVDSDNYDKPMDLVYTTHFYMLDPLVMKKSFYYFRMGTIVTDYGWILKDEESYRKFTFDSLVTDSISISQLSESQQNTLGEISLVFSKKQEKFMRTYTKIQNLAANVGGIIKVFYSVNMVIASFFTIHMMNFDLINFIFENTDQQNSKNITSTILCSSNLSKQLKIGDVKKSLNNLKTIPKSTVLISENNFSQLGEREKVNLNDLSQSNLPLEKQSLKSGLSLYKYLKRHLYCRSIYSNKFNYLEKKLVGIMDVKNYITMSNELCNIKNVFEKDLCDYNINNRNNNYNNLSKNQLLEEGKEKNLGVHSISDNHVNVKNNNFIEDIKL